MTENNTNETMTCPQCQQLISARAIVCKHCGHMLHELDGKETINTVIVSRQTFEDALDSTGAMLGGTSRFASGGILYLSVERVNSPIARYVHDEPIIIGREETGSLARNDINLSPYNARERGVSRRHAKIYRMSGELYIEDLESSNGTMVNGEVAPPNVPIKIRDGDEILLGRMMVWVNF
jgi:pSer/pThr/pTyr-binding forkhead associated (FHA) protein